MRVLIPFWLGVPEACFYQEFAIGVSEALLELGHEPSYFPFNNRGTPSANETASLVRQLDRGRPDVVLDIACWGYGLSQMPATPRSPRPIFDAYGISYAGLLFDQPFNQAINAIVASRLYAVYPDLGHPQQVRLVHPSVKVLGEVFAPPAIRSAMDRSGSGSAAREIDVLYVGNLDLYSTSRFWHDRINSRFPAGFDPEFCDAVVAAVMVEPERSLHLAVEAVRSRRPTSEGFDFNLHLRVIEAHLRNVFRRDAVIALARAGVRMRVVGREWHKLGLPANVELQESTTYDGMLRLGATARICLDASTYLDGVNDRVFAYALNGAVCFTNASGYLRGALGDKSGVRFYSMRDTASLVHEVRSGLGRVDELAELGQDGRAAVLAAHTWRHRVAHILNGVIQNPA